MNFLIIDDDAETRAVASKLLKSAGHLAVDAANSGAAVEQIQLIPFDVALLDLKLNEAAGVDLPPKLREKQTNLDVVVWGGGDAKNLAVEAARLGANEFLQKPFTEEQLRGIITKMTRCRALKRRIAELESRLANENPALDLHTEEAHLRQIYELAGKAAANSGPMLITGEAGAGKGVLARAIHKRSPQAENPFITVQCQGFPPDRLQDEIFGHLRGASREATQDGWGKVAAAERGTLFFDEIGALPLQIQAKLLRLLQTQEYTRIGGTKPHRAILRVIAATNRDLEVAAEAGEFRHDLLAHLKTTTIHLPALRQRLQDLPRIAKGYLRFFSLQCGKNIIDFSAEARQAMLRYPWPGNLRELRNFVERTAILASGSVVELCDLPEKLAAPQSSVQVGLKVSIDQLEQEHIRLIVQQTRTLEEAAHVLGIDPATLYRKRKRMGKVQANGARPVDAMLSRAAVA